MTNKSYAINRRQNYVSKLTINLLFAFSLAFILFAGQGVFAQGSNIEKNTYQPTNKTKKSKPKPKKEPAKVVPKKTSPKKAKPKRTRPKRISKKSRPKNSILVTFTTSEPMFEVMNGEEQLGITDETAKLELWMKKNNYLISVKNQDGEVVVDSQLVSINKENTDIKLISKPIVVEPVEPTAEQILQEKAKETAEVAEKITEILKRYGDPMMTNTITLEDWEYIYQNAQSNTSKKFTAIQIEAQRWFSTGQIELAKGNYANSYTAFAEAVKYMPDSAYPYYGLGEAYLANKKVSDALTAYQEAVKIDPTFALAIRKIGDIYLSSNNTKESATYFESAIKNGFDTPAVRIGLAKSYRGNKRWEDAARELEAVVKEAPTDDVYLTLGQLYTELKRNISAYESYKRATELAPESAPAFYKLGEILHEEKEYERAKVAFEQALELDDKGKQINVSLTKKFIRESAQKLK